MNEYTSLIVYTLCAYAIFIVFVLICVYLTKTSTSQSFTRPRKLKSYSKPYIKAWLAIVISPVKVADLHHELRKYTRDEDSTVEILNSEINKTLTITFTLNGEIPLAIVRTYYDWFECGSLDNLVNDILIEYYDKLADDKLLNSRSNDKKFSN